MREREREGEPGRKSERKARVRGGRSSDERVCVWGEGEAHLMHYVMRV